MESLDSPLLGGLECVVVGVVKSSLLPRLWLLAGPITFLVAPDVDFSAEAMCVVCLDGF